MPKALSVCQLYRKGGGLGMEEENVLRSYKLLAWQQKVDGNNVQCQVGQRMPWLELEQRHFDCKDNGLTARITSVAFPRTLKVNAF